MNENILYFIGAIFLGVVVILFFIKKWLSEMSNKNNTSTELVEWLKSVSTQLESSNQNVDRKLTQNMQQFNERLDKAAFVIAEVQKNIGEFSEIGRGMKDLQEFLQSPKLRGNIGEQILKDLLQQFFPKQSFALQYTFKSGEKVDAVIKTSNGLIAIDAKFPMENFKKMMSSSTTVKDKEFSKKEFIKDVKKHISDIAKKYILPAEETVDYALMYIPAESVYYEIIHSEEIYTYASKSRVLIVSPMSFYAYMKAILMSFEGQKIEAKAKEILSVLQSLQKDYEKTDESLSLLNKHITNAYNQVGNVTKQFLSFGQKLDRTKLLEDSQPKLSELEKDVQEDVLL